MHIPANSATNDIYYVAAIPKLHASPFRINLLLRGDFLTIGVPEASENKRTVSKNSRISGSLISDYAQNYSIFFIWL